MSYVLGTPELCNGLSQHYRFTVGLLSLHKLTQASPCRGGLLSQKSCHHARRLRHAEAPEHVKPDGVMNSIKEPYS